MATHAIEGTAIQAIVLRRWRNRVSRGTGVRQNRPKL